jgi:hypothetical protein
MGCILAYFSKHDLVTLLNEILKAANFAWDKKTKNERFVFTNFFLGQMFRAYNNKVNVSSATGGRC